MTDQHEPSWNPSQPQADPSADEAREIQSRRDFLLGLGKWSQAVIVGAVAGGTLLTQRSAQAAWLNRRGGRGAGWVNGGGGGTGWLNGGGGGSWANRRGGGWGGSWVNRR